MDKVWIEEISDVGSEEISTYTFSKNGHIGFLVLYVEANKSSDAIIKILKAFNE